MTTARESVLARILAQHENEILEQWMREQLAAVGRTDLVSTEELREQSREFLNLLTATLQRTSNANIEGAEFDLVRQTLAQISRSRGLAGFSPSQTATFVFSLKRPLLAEVVKAVGKDAEALATESWKVTELLDQFGLFTTEVHQTTREEVITRQQQEMLELSTPVVKLWDGVLALPMIGTLDSARTQVVMETLLQRIVETGAEVAIIDITGVPTVDTLVAQHLLKTVTAARLMGADCIISGIRPQIAQTIVHLGVELADVATKATLADAFRLAMQRMGMIVTRPAHKA